MDARSSHAALIKGIPECLPDELYNYVDTVIPKTLSIGSLHRHSSLDQLSTALVTFNTRVSDVDCIQINETMKAIPMRRRSRLQIQLMPETPMETRVLSSELPFHWNITASFSTIREAARHVDKETLGYQEHTVDFEEDAVEWREVEGLVQNTWKPESAGYGKDAKGLSHSHIEVMHIHRIENPRLYKLYVDEKKAMLGRLEAQHCEAFSNLQELPGKSGQPVMTGSVLSDHGYRFLQANICPQINECYLFHGSSEDLSIPQKGLLQKHSKAGMLGAGLYTAESSTKADQYADRKDSRTDGYKTMYLVRVLLGEIYVNTKGNPSAFIEPPSKVFHSPCKSRCPRFDSVVDDAGRLFREFVVYKESQCYTEYLVTYKRVHEPVRKIPPIPPDSKHPSPLTQRQEDLTARRCRLQDTEESALTFSLLRNVSHSMQSSPTHHRDQAAGYFETKHKRPGDMVDGSSQSASGGRRGQLSSTTTSRACKPRPFTYSKQPRQINTEKRVTRATIHTRDAGDTFDGTSQVLFDDRRGQSRSQTTSRVRELQPFADSKLRQINTESRVTQAKVRTRDSVDAFDGTSQFLFDEKRGQSRSQTTSRVRELHPFADSKQDYQADPLHLTTHHRRTQTYEDGDVFERSSGSVFDGSSRSVFDEISESIFDEILLYQIYSSD